MTSISNPKVVPATAFGRRFRSTTEARWATFLTALGVPWEYEPETYDLGYIDNLLEKPEYLGWYLPDFWLPAQRQFLEIKASAGVDFGLASRKAERLAEVTKFDVLMARGYGVPAAGYDWLSGNEPGTIEIFFAHGGWDAPYAFSACVCGAVGCSFEARTDYIPRHRCGHPRGTPADDHRDCEECVVPPNQKSGKRSYDLRRLQQAYEAGAFFRPDSR